MVRYLLGAAATLLAASGVWAGELDREFKGSPAVKAVAAPNADEARTLAAATELDRESPTDAHRRYGYGGGYGGYYGGYRGGYASYYGGYRGGYGGYYGGYRGGYGGYYASAYYPTYSYYGSYGYGGYGYGGYGYGSRGCW